MEIIKQDGEYAIVKNGDRYEVHCNDEVLKTPGGKIADTLYLPLAERLMQDWKELGYESFYEAGSILSYHFTMVENFAPLGRDAVLAMLNSMNWENEWTFQGCPSPNPHVYMKWMTYFGGGNKDVLVRQWLENQTVMQLVASTCVYNAFMSYNVAFFMAVVVEELPKTKQKKAIKEFYEFYSMFDQMFSFDEFWKIFDCFRVYYGIHLEEEGKHLPQPEE